MSQKLNASRQVPEFDISVSNEQARHAIDEQQLCDAARAVLAESDFSSATISVAVVDDIAMRELNRQYLNHDWPTDVLSFSLEKQDTHLEGEVIISADTAASSATELGCPEAAEQLLYVIHGTLHLVGYGDKTPDETQEMRAAEARILGQFGFKSCFHPESRDHVSVADGTRDSSNGAS